MPDASVVIPAYKAAAFIHEAVESVLAQTFTNREIIIVNDGSPDTPELERALAPYRDHITYVVQENRGASNARNHGVRIARGEFVAFLDADDRWRSTYLETLIGALRLDPETHVMYANPRLFGEGFRAGKSFMEVSKSEGEITFERLIRLECNVSSSVTARRATLLKAGLFDESLPTAEDFDLWLRVVKMGYRIGYTRENLLDVRVQPGSLSSNKDWMYRDFLRVLDKAERIHELTPSERAAIADMRERYHAEIQLHQGRAAFFKGDTETAVQRLSAANRYFRSRKLSLALIGLRWSPRLLLAAYHLRDRLVFRTDTRA
jgi:glycosyltransferase involved in cell wall biosynthesis